jgi:SRSO17 transposase
MPSNGDEASNGLRPSWSRWSRCWASSERRAAATSYVQGLLMPGQRKSIEPMAARLGVPSQRLQQFVADSPWDENALWGVIRRRVLPHLEPTEAWIVDSCERGRENRINLPI